MYKTLFVFICLVLSTTPVVFADYQLVRIVQATKPAVVLVRAFDKNNELIGVGTGFFVNSKGHLITNHHVIKDVRHISVRTSKGQEYPVSALIAYDIEADLVKLDVDIPAGAVSFLKVVTRLPPEGSTVAVIGNPLGLEATVSTGIISAIRDIPEFGRIIQISAPVSPGSSGSPVIDSRGNVIGVVTFLFKEGQNLNFAIASEKILGLKTGADGLVAKGEEHARPAIQNIAPEDVQMLYKEALGRYEAEQWSEALQIFKKVTKINPGHGRAWMLAGNCSSRLNSYQEAIAAYRQAIKSDRSCAESYYNLGVAYSQLGRHRDAIAAYRQTIRLKPDSIGAHYSLGIINWKAGNREAALHEYQILKRMNEKEAQRLLEIISQ